MTGPRGDNVEDAYEQKSFTVSTLKDGPVGVGRSFDGITTTRLLEDLGIQMQSVWEVRRCH